MSPAPVVSSSPDPASLGCLRAVPYMGVIYVVAEAMKLGFVNGDPDWCNLGQGQPEVGPLPGAPPRVEEVRLEPGDHAYGPLEGIPELREAVAATVNRLFRQGRKPYGPEHVAVASGGRLALTRAMAALGSTVVGYQVPDYTAYEDMLDLHLGRITAVPVRGREEDGFAVTSARLREAVQDQGLGAWLFSNPCNPTGNVLRGAELGELVDLARTESLTLLSDEFYSHFVYDRPTGSADDRTLVPGTGPVSACTHVEDPDTDPVLVFDGLTKSHRYPGWRIGWVLGPPAMVEAIARTASAIDGGPGRIAQRAALRALEPDQADAETRTLREVFCRKRNLMVERLEALGIRCARRPEGTFYVWASLADLPAPFHDGMEFFRRALERKVMTVPGVFFDVDPGRRRRSPSPYRSWMRFSFGPPEDNVRLGLDRLQEMLG